MASGKALWIFSSTVKNFISKCWKVRERTVGYIGVSANGLVFDPPGPRRYFLISEPSSFRLDVSDRHAWAGWIPSASDSPVARRGHKAFNFFVVWRGRSRGVFYRWCDVRASVAGFFDARFKGFDSKSEAYQALRDGWKDHVECWEES